MANTLNAQNRENAGEEAPLVVVYADEACVGNGQPDAKGGFAALIEFQRADGTIQRFDMWGSARGTTNNRMAIRSVVAVFTALSRKNQRLAVRFVGDARYIIDGMGSWVHRWERQDWLLKKGNPNKPVLNADLWKEAVAAAAPHKCQWEWVRGHDGHPQNEYADRLAERAAAMQDFSIGLVPSKFEIWHAGSGLREPDPFPFAFVETIPAERKPKAKTAKPRVVAFDNLLRAPR